MARRTTGNIQQARRKKDMGGKMARTYRGAARKRKKVETMNGTRRRTGSLPSEFGGAGMGGQRTPRTSYTRGAGATRRKRRGMR